MWCILHVFFINALCSFIIHATQSFIIYASHSFIIHASYSFVIHVSHLFIIHASRSFSFHLSATQLGASLTFFSLWNISSLRLSSQNAPLPSKRVCKQIYIQKIHCRLTQLLFNLVYIAWMHIFFSLYFAHTCYKSHFRLDALFSSSPLIECVPAEHQVGLL